MLQYNKRLIDQFWITVTLWSHLPVPHKIGTGFVFLDKASNGNLWLYIMIWFLNKQLQKYNQGSILPLIAIDSSLEIRAWLNGPSRYK